MDSWLIYWRCRLKNCRMDIQVDNQTRLADNRIASHPKGSPHLWWAVFFGGSQESSTLPARKRRGLWWQTVLRLKIKAHRSRKTKLLPGVFTKGLQLLPLSVSQIFIFHLQCGHLRYIFSQNITLIIPYRLSGKLPSYDRINPGYHTCHTANLSWFARKLINLKLTTCPWK